MSQGYHLGMHQFFQDTLHLIEGVSISHLLRTYGYWLIGIWTALEGETVVIIAGFLAKSQGIFSLPKLIAVAWAGSFCGDQIYFWLGRRHGPKLLRRFPKWQPGIDRALSLLSRYSTFFILTFRFVYGIRNFSSLAVGMSPISWRRFAVLNFIAAGIWATSFSCFGYFFAGIFQKSELGRAGFYISLGALFLFLIVVWLLVTGPSRRAKRRAHRAALEAAKSQDERATERVSH
jgi:membrane protein DedA with SNARE-associated domain